MYFLTIALLELIPALRVGFLMTYWNPIVIIMVVSCVKELIDEIQRRKKDKSINSEIYKFIKKFINSIRDTKNNK